MWQIQKFRDDVTSLSFFSGQSDTKVVLFLFSLLLWCISLRSFTVSPILNVKKSKTHVSKPQKVSSHRRQTEQNQRTQKQAFNEYKIEIGKIDTRRTTRITSYALTAWIYTSIGCYLISRVVQFILL